jgi:hypothetical protein
MFVWAKWEYGGGEMEPLMSRKNAGETCVICEQIKKEGIHLYTTFICTDCEKDIIQTETDDPKYQFYLQQLKKLTAPQIFT